MFSLTKSIVDDFSINLCDSVNNGMERWNICYSKYGLGMSVLAIPFYILGENLSHIINIDMSFTTKFCVSMINSLITAMMCVMIYKFAMDRFSFSIQTSTLLSLAYGLSTIAWVYSEDFMSEPVTGLLIFCAVYHLTSPLLLTKKNAFISGLFLGMAIFCRIAAVIAVPAFLVYCFLLLRKEPEEGIRKKIDYWPGFFHHIFYTM